MLTILPDYSVTVRNITEAERANDAGAMFFVTPNIDVGVIGFARNKDIPVVAGALTPTEVCKAWDAGASLVKVFPCRAFGGPQYIRELRGPFDYISLGACRRIPNLLQNRENRPKFPGIIVK
jgi:2-dehydro-3-deoxyphosphogluconate aldolase/(4S)-4-hydroxy-2-oxoglutarate aldolase